jgi:putative ABC transport system permease protein
VAEEEGALISEPLSRATGLGVGDRIPLAGPAGEASFPVIGVFYDYGNERGAVFLDLAALEPLFGPGPPHAIGLYLEKDRDPERMVQRVRATFPDLPLRVRSNRRLREDVFRVFDQTFAITRFLELVCLAVAVCGITLTLLILARERISELALYRALGARRRQIFRIFLGKGMGIAVLGIGLGLAGGIALAAILIFVINRAWFGWTIQVHWPWTGLAAEMLLILLAAAAASLYPAARASRTPATELSREEVA